MSADPFYEAYTDTIPFAHRGENVAVYAPVVILKPEVISAHDGARIDSFVKIEGGQGVVINRWVHICSFVHINSGGGLVWIGEGVGIASHVTIVAGTNAEAGYYMSAAAPEELQIKERSTVYIGKGAWIGAGAVILPGVRIGEFAMIGAGAVVTKDVPAREVWAGVPARKLRDRQGSDE